jgi:group I intron endonuclease
MIVYKITNLFYGTSYIGQTVETLQSRWRDHISSAARGSRYYFHNAIRKYGPDAFSIEVLQECKSRKEMDFAEKFYISTLNTKAPFGYNLTDGGGGMKNYHHSEETRKKISKSLEGNTRQAGKRSEESIQRMRVAQRKAWDARGECSEETRRKISLSKIGKPGGTRGMKLPPRSEEFKRKMSEAAKKVWEKRLTNV